MSNNKNAKPRLLIVMGISGCGKSTAAQYLASKFKWQYVEADDFHTPEAKARMRKGLPLTDDMREPWIDALCTFLKKQHQQKKNCVLAYSGLRRQHRQRFRELGFSSQFVLLNGDLAIIRERMNMRAGHFMPASLLESQIDSLDPPQQEDDITMISIDNSEKELLAYTQHKPDFFN